MDYVDDVAGSDDAQSPASAAAREWRWRQEQPQKKIVCQFDDEKRIHSVREFLALSDRTGTGPHRYRHHPRGESPVLAPPPRDRRPVGGSAVRSVVDKFP